MSVRETSITGVADRGDETRAATSALEAIVFREILTPLAAGLGPVADVALGSVADSLFARPTPVPSGGDER